MRSTRRARRTDRDQAPEAYVTASDAAERLSVSPRTVKRWAYSGVLPGATRLGGKLLRIPVRSIEGLVVAGQIGGARCGL
jgi:excisionase family DNA binding protein